MPSSFTNAYSNVEFQRRICQCQLIGINLEPQLWTVSEHELEIEKERERDRNGDGEIDEERIERNINDNSDEFDAFHYAWIILYRPWTILHNTTRAKVFCEEFFGHRRINLVPNQSMGDGMIFLFSFWTFYLQSHKRVSVKGLLIWLLLKIEKNVNSWLTGDQIMAKNSIS